MASQLQDGHTLGVLASSREAASLNAPTETQDSMRGTCESQFVTFQSHNFNGSDTFESI